VTHRPEDEVDVLQAGTALFRGRDRRVTPVDGHGRPDPLDHLVGQFTGPLKHPSAQQCNLREGLSRPPAAIGHSFGGLITQQLAGRGLATVSVPIDSAPFRGVLPLPMSALKSTLPVIGNPANYRRAVALTYDQFRYSFANAVSESEAKRLYEMYPVAGSGIPLFQAAATNFNPFTEIKVDTKTPQRGPMLLITGERDHIAPAAIANASYQKQKRNTAAIIREIPNRAHSLVFDGGWQEIAEAALAFVEEHH
jgi:non-heme chloroperoxidase